MVIVAAVGQKLGNGELVRGGCGYIEDDLRGMLTSCWILRVTALTRLIRCKMHSILKVNPGVAISLA
jgi:hypothetical protein